MEITGILTGIDTLINNLEGVKAKTATAQSLGLKRVALKLRDTIVGTYVGAGHPEGPEVQTGRLKASIRYAPTTPTDSVAVGSDADYAPDVEFGHAQTPGRFVPAIGKRLVAESVKPYPFFRPAMTDVFDSGDGQKLFEGAVKEVLGL